MIKLNSETLRYIAALQNKSGARVNDCIVTEEMVTYVVDEGQLGVAIGKNGKNVNEIRGSIDKKIHIVEFGKDPVKFAKNLLGKGVQIKNVTLDEKDGKKVIIIECNPESKGAVLGKGGRNIRMIQNLMRRHHQVDDVQVK